MSADPISRQTGPTSPDSRELSAMLSKVLRTGVAVACLVAVVALVNAQQPPQAQPPATASGVVAAQPGAAAVTYRAKQILGSKIMINNNTAVGTVDDIVFDGAGNLEYLIVGKDGKMTTVPWDAAKWDLKSQTGTVNVTPQTWQTIPTYTTTTYPDFWTPTYRSQVYKYYNLTPRELRRLQRTGRP
jgi:hypothetical protein